MLPEPMMKVWRPQGFAGVEVERFDNVKDLVIPPFALAGHDVVVVIEGDATVKYAGKQHRFTKVKHLFLSQHPGEVFSADGRSDKLMSVWTLRLYPEAMQQLKADLGLPSDFSYFPEMMAPTELNDTLAKLTTETILSFDQAATTLERESKLFDLLHAVLTHCSDTPPPEVKLGQEHKAVSLIKEALHTHPEFDHTLTDLAHLTKLNKHHLWEVFKRDVGLSPDQYQAYLRVHKAKDLLTKGMSIVQTALEVGFSDQSHLNRVFKKYVQVTPGRFQKDSLSS